jgi:cyclopropane fatty-acyl-phospholipid synthase-like methyltransferase
MSEAKERNTVDEVFDTNRRKQWLYPEATVSFYLMESAREGARLEAKTDPIVSEQQLRQTGLQRGMRALDMGCGTGA